MAEFQVESIFESGGRVYVIARQLDLETSFEVPFGASLGGVPVERWMDVPRALDAEGRQRMDVYGFCLKDIGDRDRLEVGVQAELSSRNSPSARGGATSARRQA